MINDSVEECFKVQHILEYHSRILLEVVRAYAVKFFAFIAGYKSLA